MATRVNHGGKEGTGEPRFFEPELGGVPAAFGLTVALALISYQWLERPFLKLKDRFAAVPSGRAP